MKIERVLLVSAPLDREVNRKEAVNSHCFPPLGLLAIATRLQREIPDIEVRVVDGDLVGLESVENLLGLFRPNLVGVSALTPSYKSALAIARHAKATGTRHVVFGNDHASFFPEIILRRHPDISFIIAGDHGDRDFVDFAIAVNKNLNLFEAVSNLCGFVGGEFRSSSIHNRRPITTQTPLVGAPDPVFLTPGSMARYQESYMQRFGAYHAGKIVKPFIVNNAKGCYKANDRCFYCSIYDLQRKTGTTKSFWEAIWTYQQEYDLNFFFEVCDNFGSLSSYRRSLVADIPSWFDDSNIELMVYADANIICRDRHIIEDFRRLHIRRVNIGFDSADPSVLSVLKGFKDAEINRRAMALLSTHNIQIHCSFVLGGLGENEKSLANTVALIEEALQAPHVVAIEVSPLFPLPHAPAWNLFLGEFGQTVSQSVLETLLPVPGRRLCEYEHIWKETRNSFLGNDLIDLTLASRMWINYFTAVNYEQLLAMIANLNRRIAAAGKVTGGFG